MLPLIVIVAFFLLYGVFHFWGVAFELTRENLELKHQLAAAYDRLDWFNHQARPRHADDLDWPELDAADGQMSLPFDHA